ncbi:MAG TPA: type II toxin-antitoxin system RelE/ParE family toxin [Pyrinomonadaceae bacterium]|nr:type II toxin-antitoxin system RelE/ParE family toxin [Pyrinomonadaceae bacterium]
MSYEISRAREFIADIDEIFVYIGVDNVDAALRFTEAVDETLELISTQPFAGFQRQFDNARLGPVRFWPVKGFDRYLIAYQPDRELRMVRALRVLNSYRDFNPIFSDE